MGNVTVFNSHLSSGLVLPHERHTLLRVVVFIL